MHRAQDSTSYGGWRLAVRHALIAFVLAAGTAELIVILLVASAHGPTPGAVDVAAAGGALFFAFHGVDLIFHIPRGLFPASAAPLLGPQTTATITLAPLAATLLIGWLLARGGRAVARASV